VSTLWSSIHCTDRTLRPLKVEALTQPHRSLRTPCYRGAVYSLQCVCRQVWGECLGLWEICKNATVISGTIHLKPQYQQQDFTRWWGRRHVMIASLPVVRLFYVVWAVLASLRANVA